MGGCVRDLLLGLKPYDFDVVTNARPEQVRHLFQRCRIIGRRFKLAHVRIGREVIEVSTYRSKPNQRSSWGEKAHFTSQGRILRDNVYGDIEQDVFRRDLSINALYMNLPDLSILDYVNGYSDLKNSHIRVIGNPQRRFKEDPVRMLRTVRFGASLNYQIEDLAIAAIKSQSHLLTATPHSRLADELTKLFFCGNAVQAFNLMREFKLLPCLLPSYSSLMRPDKLEQITAYMNLLFGDTDRRVNEQVYVSSSYTLAALLWLPFKTQSNWEATAANEKNKKKRKSNKSIADRILDKQSERSFISLTQRQQIKNIWWLQSRLEKEAGKSVLSERSFRPALRLLELSSQVW